MTSDQEFQKNKNLFSERSPSKEDIQNWKLALRQRKQKFIRQAPLWIQWAVAASIGFVVGGTVIHFHESSKPSTSLTSEKFHSDATFETVYNNLD